MVANDQLTSLSAGEIANLWTTYQGETLEKTAMTFFLQHVTDRKVKNILENFLALANKRIQYVEKVFHEENYAIPAGFTESDVNLQAPRLFSDKLYLEYILNSSMLHLTTYSMAMLNAVNLGIQNFYYEVITDTQKVEMKTKQLAKDRGMFGDEPRLPIREKTTFVKKDSFMSGLIDIQRPLLGSEIAQLILQARRNALGHAVITAFRQVAESKDVRKFLEKGQEIARKHFDILSGILHDDSLPNSTTLWTSEVTDSTKSPFSDKLMVNFITTLISASIGAYAVSMTESPRHDLTTKYTKLISDVGRYSQDGANLLIKNGWMEQPPMAANRKDLGK